MFSVDELLSKKNQKNAFAHFKTKRDSKGSDGMFLSELEEYWQLNGDRICEEIRNKTYCPCVIENYEIVNLKGKRRIVSNLGIVDRYITRLLSQKLQRYFEVDFLANSCAYQENKGILDAIMMAQNYLEQGKTTLIEIDIKDYFDTIPLETITSILEKSITDNAVTHLIKEYLYCKIEFNNRIENKTIGLVQGNSISPILSNVYLHEFDVFMQTQGYSWIRFADNIYIYEEDKVKAVENYNMLCEKLQQEYKLSINSGKSGVYDAFSRRVLGYEFIRKNKGVEVRKFTYKRQNTYGNWNTSAIQKLNHEYHIIQDGVLNKKDYSLLFENEEEKHHIPVETVEQLNIYSNVTISSGVLATLANKNIRCGFFNKYGYLEGYFIANRHNSRADVLLSQCKLYTDSQKRFQVAKDMEIASVHNMRSNIRYYEKKKQDAPLKEVEHFLSESIVSLNQAKSHEELMLIEARAKQQYYQAFNYILGQEEFLFTKRTKRPPKDCINALISFGNTLLYNQVLQIIWKTSLEPQIGIVHATNRRSYSLNLDFADIYKPIIVDRIIFSMINLRRLNAKEDFVQNEDGGIYLSKRGKKIFIEEFENKLQDEITFKGKKYTYKQLMEWEVRQFQKYVEGEDKYKPYKYY